MTRFMLFAAFFASFTSFSLFAQCPEGTKWIEGTRITQGEFSQTKTCYLSVSPTNTQGGVYRNFLFTSRGLMMTFASYGSGPSSTHTGANEFIFFPLLQNPDYEIQEDLLVVTMANGKTVTFDLLKGVPLVLEGANWRVEPVQRDEVVSGVKISRYPGVWMDLGFQKGMSPSWYSWRDSHLKDERGETCQIKNGEFFVKKDDETFYRYPTNERLRGFFSRRCPRINLWDERV